jgi:predicted AlkP superfamily phosphohydrolase/phosphomutase
VFGYNYLFDTIETALRRTGLYHWLKRRIAQSSSDDDSTDLARLLTLSQDDIDWTTTVAFTVSADGQLYLNTTQQHDTGAVSPEDYEAVRDELRTTLQELRDPDTGEQVVQEILDGETVYDGSHLETAPDLVVLPEPGYEFTFPQTMQTKRLFHPPEKPSSHTSRREQEGIFLAWGSAIDTMSGVTMSLTDFAPTALAVLDVPVPDAMDGTVREDLFTRTLDTQYESMDDRVLVKRSIRAVADNALGN